jgi:RNA polymerase sigma-70 factor (ECF subfamily)
MPEDPHEHAGTGPAWGSVIAAAQVGAEWALTILYRRFQPSLVRYLRARAAGDEEDVASDVWIDAARALPGFSGDEDAFGRWIFTIARRRAIDLTRKRGRRRTDPAPPPVFTGVAGQADPEQSVLDRMAGDEAAARIVAILPKDQADIVLLRIVGGLSVAAVAEIVGRTPGQVSVIQHRALRRLARALGTGADVPSVE